MLHFAPPPTIADLNPRAFKILITSSGEETEIKSPPKFNGLELKTITKGLPIDSHSLGSS